MPILIKPTGEAVDLNEGVRKKSRESLFVYLHEYSAYKIFSTIEQATASLEAIKFAKAAGVPVVRCASMYPATMIDDQGNSNDVFVLEMEKHIGQFFQLSKRGGVPTLVSAVGVSAEIHPELWRKVARAFNAAQEHCITDPQGFFDPILDMPIRFSDIHTGNHPAPQLEEVIEICEKLYMQAVEQDVEKEKTAPEFRP